MKLKNMKECSNTYLENESGIEQCIKNRHINIRLDNWLRKVYIQTNTHKHI